MLDRCALIYDYKQNKNKTNGGTHHLRHVSITKDGTKKEKEKCLAVCQTHLCTYALAVRQTKMHACQTKHNKTQLKKKKNPQKILSPVSKLAEENFSRNESRHSTQ